MNKEEGLERYLLKSFWESDQCCILGEEDFPAFPRLPEGAVCFSSSGTSGVEKWVVHNRDSLLSSASAVNDHLQVTHRDVWGLILPYHHVGGFGVLARSYLASCVCSIYAQKWNPHSATTFLESEGVTITSMVPTQVYDIVHSGLSSPSSLRAVLVGGGALSETLGQQARELGWPVLQTYGMSEAGSQIATASLDSLEIPFTNTRLPILPIWEVKVEESLVIAGEALSLGILYREKEGLRYVPHDEFVTSDRVEISDDRLTYFGRLDRTVKIKGELVNIDELERSLEQYLDDKVLLITVPDERSGNSLYGFSESLFTIDQINDYLPSCAQLEFYQQLEKFPTSALGKIDRRALKAFINESKFR